MSGGPGFIDLNARPPVPPPVPGAPPHQGGPRPNMGQPSAQARMHHQQQVGGMPMHQAPRVVNAAPPQAPQFPQQHSLHSPVEVVDIRMERMSSSQAREMLSEYHVYRFEKIMDQDRFDNEGKPLPPNWQQVHRSQENDPKVEVLRQIARLNKKHTLSEKKKELNADQLYNIDKTLDQLKSRLRNPDLEVKLVQLDDQLKPFVENGRYNEKGKRDEKDKDKKNKNKKSKHNTSKTKLSWEKKPKWQRVAIIAYYKIGPKPEVDALAFLARQQQEQRMAHQVAQDQRRFQQQMQREQQEHQLRDAQNQRNFPPPHFQQGQHRPGPHGPAGGHHGPGHHPRGPTPIQVIHEDHSDSGSSDESGSDSDSCSSMSTEVTRPSSKSNSTGRRYRRKPRYIEETYKPRHFGKHKGAHRRHTMYGGSEYTIEPGVSTALRDPRSSTVSSGVSSARVQEIRQNAYAAGIADGKTEARIEAQRIDDLVERRVAREIPRAARVIQSPVVVDDRDRIVEDFQRVHIVDTEPTTRYRHVPRNFDELDDLDSLRGVPIPRRPVYETHRGPEVRSRPWEALHRDASRYMDSQESPILAPENPFTPLAPRREGGQYRHRYP
ncbi:uncharacterized protein E0L32_007255 [Thyridium curvatum]|uniref:Uncharacterized protein n=1 Tax=Thyridium curvatum TaxID=1093900 RepID=A0A507B680_9PEZI|nr:uncharacterized protein E0L32_007255 [Thyridium curvatum]TPX12140.1 hypothetical protein E0L32_007255 [Thyridium curvatum]